MGRGLLFWGCRDWRVDVVRDGVWMGYGVLVWQYLLSVRNEKLIMLIFDLLFSWVTVVRLQEGNSLTTIDSRKVYHQCYYTLAHRMTHIDTLRMLILSCYRHTIDINYFCSRIHGATTHRFPSS